MSDPVPFDPTPGAVCWLSPDIRRIVAPNPSPMTFRGTNSYLVGHGEVAVIDPGPDDDRHLAALLAALAPGERITHVLVTHSHLDHSPLARRIDAPVYGFGTHLDGRSAVMQSLADQGLAGGGEGIDTAFAPDIWLRDGEVVQGTGWQMTALWTPGHIANHLCFAFGDALFSGDHVMGWASSLVSPPDGDLTAFMESCRKLQSRSDVVYHPGHGAPVPTPNARLKWLIQHRLQRETQILQALTIGPHSIPALTARIYADVAPALLPAAARNVFAHLIDLSTRDLVHPNGPLSTAALYQLSER